VRLYLPLKGVEVVRGIRFGGGFPCTRVGGYVKKNDSRVAASYWSLGKYGPLAGRTHVFIHFSPSGPLHLLAVSSYFGNCSK